MGLGLEGGLLDSGGCFAEWSSRGGRLLIESIVKLVEGRRERHSREKLDQQCPIIPKANDIQVASFLRAISRNFLMSWICLG